MATFGAVFVVLGLSLLDARDLLQLITSTLSVSLLFTWDASVLTVIKVAMFWLNFWSFFRHFRGYPWPATGEPLTPRRPIDRGDTRWVLRCSDPPARASSLSLTLPVFFSLTTLGKICNSHNGRLSDIPLLSKVPSFCSTFCLVRISL